jgi:hypothetical protein
MNRDLGAMERGSKRATTTFRISPLSIATVIFLCLDLRAMERGRG